MIDTDKENFRTMMNIVMANYGRKPLEKEVLRFWFGKLEKHDLQTVSQAFDTWIDTQSELPAYNQIAGLCKPKVTIHARLPSPLSIESNKRHAEEIKQAVSSMVKPRKDSKGWARKIMADPANYPDIAQKFASEALAVDYG